MIWPTEQTQHLEGIADDENESDWLTDEDSPEAAVAIEKASKGRELTARKRYGELKWIMAGGSEPRSMQAI